MIDDDQSGPGRAEQAIGPANDLDDVGGVGDANQYHVTVGHHLGRRVDKPGAPADQAIGFGLGPVIHDQGIPGLQQARSHCPAHDAKTNETQTRFHANEKCRKGKPIAGGSLAVPNQQHNDQNDVDQH